jgi:hypothetical protein
LCYKDPKNTTGKTLIESTTYEQREKPEERRVFTLPRTLPESGKRL